MSTLHLYASNPADLAVASELLRTGRLVAFATETVYGLGANALDPTAVAAIFTAKQRPSWDPLIVHLASISQLSSITRIPEDLAPRIQRLAESFWPGPLTLLLPRAASVPDSVTAGRELVGVRIPDHPSAQALLRAVGLPIAAPSANTFGHTSPTTAQHVLDDLDGRITAVFDAGPTSIGIESTVLDPNQTPMVVYRPGAITAAELSQAAEVPVIAYESPVAATAPESLPSPGVGIRHYAPRARLILIEAGNQDFQQSLLERNAWHVSQGDKVGVLLPASWAALPETHVFSWGMWDNPAELSQSVYNGLRTLDDAGATVILCPLPPESEQTAALRDRLLKAARNP